MRSGWLLREGTVLAAADEAERMSERARGLLGRQSFDGALLLPHTRSVHTAFMRFPLDVAILDSHGTVLALLHMPPWRICAPRPKARSVLEAPAGSFERWSLAVGDWLEFRPAR